MTEQRTLITIIMDGQDAKNVLMTKDQIRLMDWMEDQGYLHEDLAWDIQESTNFEAI